MEERDSKTPTTEADQETTRPTVEESALPSLWGSVIHAFRQARVARLEARVRRLRRHAMETPGAGHQPLGIHAAECAPSPSDSAWRPIAMTVSRWRVGTIVVGILVALCGIALSQIPPRTRGITAAAVTAPPPEPRERPSPGDTAVRSPTLAILEERVAALHQQVDQHNDQLTNQTSALESVSHQADTQRTQLTTLAEALVTVSDQVQHVEQQLTTQATRVAAHEKQLARQATQLSTWQEPSGAFPVAPVDHGRSGPPTLELLAPPATLATAPAPNAATAGATLSVPTLSVPTPAGQRPRRTIALPASLGAVGLRTTPPATPGGPQP